MRRVWLGMVACSALLGCFKERESAVVSVAVDASVAPMVAPSCLAQSWTAPQRCALVRSIVHLDGPKGHEVEWFATECGKWPVKVDVGVRCAGHWAPLFGDGVAPDCADGQFVAVNQRRGPGKARGLLLQLSARDGGFDFALKPGRLVPEVADADPQEIDGLCGSLAGVVEPADGGWTARTVDEP